MSLDVRAFLLVALGFAALASISRTDRRISTVIGLLGLLATLAIAILMEDQSDIPGGMAELSEGTLGGSAFLRWFLVLASGAGLATCLIALAVDRLRDLPAVTLGWLGASALALALEALPIAFIAATGGGALALLSLADRRSAESHRATGTYLLVVAGSGSLAVVAAAWLGGRSGPLPLDSYAGGAAALGMALALAARLGALPFHVPNARIVRAVVPLGIPSLLGWLPAPFFLIALTWSQRVLQPQQVDLGPVPPLIMAVGVASLLLGAFGIVGRPAESDDLQHIVSYGIVQDAGLFLLAFAAFDPAIWEPARAWAIYFVVSRTAFGAWMAVLIAVRGSSMLGELAGWARDAPLMVIALLGAFAAGLGIPGLGSWDTRLAIVGSVTEPALRWIAYAGWALAYVPLVRLLWIGLRTAEAPLPEAARPRLRFPSSRPAARDVRSVAAYVAATALLSRPAIAVALACVVGLAAAALAIAPGALREAAATLPEPLLPVLSSAP